MVQKLKLALKKQTSQEKIELRAYDKMIRTNLFHLFFILFDTRSVINGPVVSAYREVVVLKMA